MKDKSKVYVLAMVGTPENLNEFIHEIANLLQSDKKKTLLQKLYLFAIQILDKKLTYIAIGGLGLQWLEAGQPFH